MFVKPVILCKIGHQVVWISYYIGRWIPKEAWIYFMNDKSDSFQMYSDFKTLAEYQAECKVRIFRFDNEGEYIVDYS